MNFRDLVKSHVLDQPTYEPGKPISYVAREFGLNPEDVVKLASNENPLGTSPKALEAARQALEEVWLYPDGGTTFLRQKLARVRGIPESGIILGNGSNEIIELLGHTLLGQGDEVVMGAHAFIVYKLVTLLFGATPIEVPMPDLIHDLDRMRDAVTERTRLVFLPSPNNPTGTANDEESILRFARSLPEQVIFVFDEAYAEYQDQPPDLRPLIEAGLPVLCLRTFSKIYGMAGFRLGYGYGPPELIQLLHRVRQPFNVNSLAQEAARAALEDDVWVESCRRANRQGLDQLEKGFSELGVRVIPSQANFSLLDFESPELASKLFSELQKEGLIVRPVGGYGLPSCLRVSVGTPDQNQRVLDTAGRLLGQFSQPGLL